jgi:hypothetical protein
MGKNNYLKKGQVVLFVIVVLTVAIIIASSIIERSLTGQRNIGINTDSSRAFNAAEAGIDELLKRTDLAQAGVYNTQSVDRSFFTQANYTITSTNPGYFGVISKDSLVQIEFGANPQNLRIYLDPTACAVISLYSSPPASSVYSVKRNFLCGDLVLGSDRINGSEYFANCAGIPSSFGSGSCLFLNFTAGQNAKMLTARILKSDSRVEFQADNFASSFLTKSIVGDSTALTISGVKKEIQIETKTTKDIYSVFDHVLYIR